MLARIYESTLPSSLVSEDGDLTNPIVFKFTQAGGNEERRLFLRHAILSGDGAESSSGVIVEAVDIAGTDESTWVQVAADVAGVAGTYEAGGAPKTLGSINEGQTLPFWIKATVPSNSEIGARDDIYLKVTGTNNNLEKLVDLSAGTYTGCAFNGADNRIEFFYDDTSDRGEYLSQWIDISAITLIQNIEFNIVNSGNAIASFRTADDSSGTNPSAWSFEGESYDTSKDWIQIRIQFFAPPTMPFSGTAAAGLARYTYTGNNFNPTGAHTALAYGTTPLATLGGANTNRRFRGFFFAPVDGSYTFGIAGADAVELYVNGTLLIQATTSLVSNSITLESGYNVVEYRHRGDNSADSFSSAQITIPGQTQRSITINDFMDDRYGVNSVFVQSVRLVYSGTETVYHDIRFYNGPATPVLIAPPNGSNTDDFNPPLTAVTANGDHLQFQLDNVNTFDSGQLTQWEVPCTNDVECTSQSPIFDRPSGVWYWRARSKLNGVYGNWSDFWVITINTFIGRNSYIYLNLNLGFDAIDLLTLEQYMYINVNGGAEEDTIYRNRHIYLNVNVALSVGEIIYPIQDRTPVRDPDFPSDAGAFL